MIKWIHRLLNPHCPECHDCPTCKELRVELDFAHTQNKALLDSILGKNEPSPRENIETEPIKAPLPWGLKRSLLEKQAKHEKIERDKRLKEMEDAKSIEDLEKVTGISESIELDEASNE